MRKEQHGIISKSQRINERLLIALRKYGIFVSIFVVLLTIGLMLHNSFSLVWEKRARAAEQIKQGIGYPGTYAYSIPLGTSWMNHDKRGTSAPAQVLEDGVPLAYPDALHADIADCECLAQ